MKRAVHTSETHVEQAYRRIKSDIVKCLLAPGSKLNIHECSVRYDVGTTPVREALSRLTASGLVVAHGNRGFRVSELSLDDLIDLTKTRLWIEEFVLRRSIILGDITWESEIIARAHELGISKENSDRSLYLDETWEERHFNFHRALISGCDSRYLFDYWERLFITATRYRRWSAVNIPDDRNVENEHRAIMQAVLDRNADEAVELMRVHMIRLVQTIARTIPDANGDPETIAADIRAGIDINQQRAAP